MKKHYIVKSDVDVNRPRYDTLEEAAAAAQAKALERPGVAVVVYAARKAFAVDVTVAPEIVIEG